MAQDLLPKPLTKADFYAFISQEPEGRFEFDGSRIIDMTGGTFSHAHFAARFAFAIQRQLDDNDWSITVADRGIELDKAVRYPEVVVEALSTVDTASRWTTTPALIVEVLSPSSVERDLEDKPAEYATIPTLHAYIVASQTEPTVWLWLRSPRRRFPVKAKKITGPIGEIVIPSLGLTLRLADIYRDLLRRSP